MIGYIVVVSLLIGTVISGLGVILFLFEKGMN